jgi:hypothetical protein
MITNETRDHVESLIDQHGLRAIVELLAELCSTKADHIATNWQDYALEAAWNLEAARLINAAARVQIDC